MFAIFANENVIFEEKYQKWHIYAAIIETLTNGSKCNKITYELKRICFS